MKRVWLAAALLLTIILIGCLALWQVSRSVELLEGDLDALAGMVADRETPQLLLERTTAFENSWEKLEETMMHFIHHNALDDVTDVVARLKALAAYGEYGELAAEIERLRHLVGHIRESETPTLATIF